MKSFKELSEQHREKGRFKPVQPHNVPNSAVVSPRPSSDSASVKLKEENIEEGMSASVRLQRALQRAKEQREREQRAGEALLKPKRADVFHPGPAANEKYVAKQIEKEKLKKEDVQQISEGRPSQRHPLEGHEYHKKSDEALVHIAKDAHAAAEAMKGHNTQAENKYRDQANDSATVRYYRQKHGMADWYKKKYGHVNEEVEQIDEISSELAKSYLAKRTATHKPDLNTPETNKYSAKIAQGKAGAAARMYGYGHDKNAVNKVTGRFEYRKKVGTTQVFSKEEVDTNPVTRTINAATNREKATQAYTTQIDKTREQQKQRIVASNASQGVTVRKEDIENDYCPDCMENPCVCGGNHISQIDEIVKTELHNDLTGMDHQSFLKKHGVTKQKAKQMAESKITNEIDEEAQLEAWSPAKQGIVAAGGGTHAERGIYAASQEKPPFDPPYKKTTGTVTDKSGAKHGPMSVARNLARQALKKQSEKLPVKESLEESRKAEIVKDAFKKAKKKNDDTFQPEPELGSTVVKADN